MQAAQQYTSANLIALYRIAVQFARTTCQFCRFIRAAHPDSPHPTMTTE